MRFKWDPTKATINVSKHGLHFEESRQVFNSHPKLRLHREIPEQWLAIGFLYDRLVAIAHEIREDAEGEFIWIISARKASKEEEKYYAKG